MKFSYDQSLWGAGRVLSTRSVKVKFSLRDAIEFQAPISNWNIKQKVT